MLHTLFKTMNITRVKQFLYAFCLGTLFLGFLPQSLTTYLALVMPIFWARLLSFLVCYVMYILSLSFFKLHPLYRGRKRVSNPRAYAHLIPPLQKPSIYSEYPVKHDL